MIANNTVNTTNNKTKDKMSTNNLKMYTFIELCNNILLEIKKFIIIYYYKIFQENRKTDVWYELLNGALKYKGEWKNGLPNGKGIMEFIGDNNNSHSKIDCNNFVNGIAQGYGIQIFDKDDDEIVIPHYEGEFKYNHHHGKGAYYFGDGSYHKGEFIEGKYHGKGIHYYTDTNETYIGTFFEDKRLRGVFIKGQANKKQINKYL
jgi:hypothetical protein